MADGIGQFVQANIVAKQEFAGYWEYLLDEAIFVAPAHPSWGGAALIDADGKLLGIGSLHLQMAAKNGGSADINMVVPIDLLPPFSMTCSLGARSTSRRGPGSGLSLPRATARSWS